MMAAQKILFVVTEDWFFASHFLSVAVAARAAGYEVAVTVRVRDPVLRARIEQAGVRVIPSRHQRGRFGPLAMVGHVQGFAMLFRAERPDIVHLISIRLIVLAGLGALLAGVRRRGRLIGNGIAALFRRAVRGSRHRRLCTETPPTGRGVAPDVGPT